MSKKLLVVVGLIALSIGGVSTVALQSHAQNVATQPTTANTATIVAASTQSTATDTDNIQDPGGVEKPDTAAAGIVTQNDAQEQGDSAAANPNETESGN